MSEADPIEKLSESVRLLEEKVTALSSDLSTLSKKEQPRKSISNNLKEYAGIVSLVIGLLLSFYSLNDAMFKKPKESLIADQEKLKTILSSIVSLDQEYAVAVQQGKGAISSPILLQRNIKFQEAEEIINNDANSATCNDHLFIASLYEFSQSIGPASKHYMAAVKTKQGDNVCRSSAEASLGRISASNGKLHIDDARSHFREAEGWLLRAPNPHTPEIVSASYSLKLMEADAECFDGNLSLGQSSLAQAREVLTQYKPEGKEFPSIDILRSWATRAEQVCTVLPEKAPAVPAKAGLASVAQNIFRLLSNSEFAKVEELEAPEMKLNYPPGSVQKYWISQTQDIGKLSRCAPSATLNDFTFQTVCDFEKGRMIVTVGLDPLGHVRGLWFNRSSS
jgi:hypothetical protein